MNNLCAKCQFPKPWLNVLNAPPQIKHMHHWKQHSEKYLNCECGSWRGISGKILYPLGRLFILAMLILISGCTIIPAKDSNTSQRDRYTWYWSKEAWGERNARIQADIQDYEFRMTNTGSAFTP